VNDFGDITADGLRFERTLEAPVDDVWAALTRPDALARWLDRADFEPRVGGAVTIHFDDGPVEGRILAYDPPSMLEYTWRIEGEPDTVLRFELEPLGGRTRLVLLHRGLPANQETGYAAGWHAHLDRLAALWTGGAVDWADRFRKLRPLYADRSSQRSGAR
jgi:uncharacterized protein YndB with AHSA1/START domain